VKLFRSKSLEVQRKALKLSIDRAKKVHREIAELSMRNWRGGEAQISADVNKARTALDEGISKLRDAEKLLTELRKVAERKGK
jgi:hypothetical protein